LVLVQDDGEGAHAKGCARLDLIGGTSHHLLVNGIHELVLVEEIVVRLDKLSVLLEHLTEGVEDFFNSLVFLLGEA